MGQEWETSAINLITHFQCVARGHVPFSQDPQKIKAQAGLDEEAYKYMTRVANMIKEQSKYLTTTLFAPVAGLKSSIPRIGI